MALLHAQVLSLLALLVLSLLALLDATRAGTQFTCFTGTKVQILTAALAQLGAERLWKLLWRLQDKDKDLIASYASTSQSRAAHPHAAKAASNSTRAATSLSAGLASSK
jgi:hypothetical protein